MNLVFASGTGNKIVNEYSVIEHQWNREDECYMKQLQVNPDNKELINYMVQRHGPEFEISFNNNLLDHDYSHCPIPILIKGKIPEAFIEQIKMYNQKSKNNLAFNFISLFYLTQRVENRTSFFIEEFDICKTSSGKTMMIDFFESMISSDCNRKTLFNEIEEIQSHYNSRISTLNDPKMFLMFLPTHTGCGTIDQLQNTILAFIKNNNLWKKYHVVKWNSKNSSQQEYNDFLVHCMEQTRKNRKTGCILLLGECGTTGVTYHDCDVVIGLDNGSNLDNLVQKIERGGTEANGKTVMISVDYKVDRIFTFLASLIYKFRKTSKTKMTNTEILYYLFENNIYKFDPLEVNYGELNKTKLMDYCKKLNETICLDDSDLLNSIVVDKDYFKNMGFVYKKGLIYSIPINELQGNESQEVDVERVKKENSDNGSETESVESEPEPETEVLINITYEMCKTFLFPLLALVSRVFKIRDFSEIMMHESTAEFIRNIIVSKTKTNLKTSDYYILLDSMAHIFKINEDIVNDIREIYAMATPERLRHLIEKHFIPSAEEKDKNAEIPTPVVLIDEMLHCFDESFWQSPKKVLEPCCGKGNFVLGIFDKFYEHLDIPDEYTRCCTIITECLYYADITSLNTFITTQLLRCHIQSLCGIDELDLNFNCYTGDALEMELPRFDAVIGNPPYNKPKDKSKLKNGRIGGGGGTSLWDRFVKTALDSWIVENGYLLFVHPPSWRKPGHYLWNIMSSKQIIYLKSITESESSKLFKCGTMVDFYLLQNTNQHTKTFFHGQDNKMYKIDLGTIDFLPSGAIDLFTNIVSKVQQSEQTEVIIPQTEVIYSSSIYDPRRPYVSKTRTGEYNLPIIHSMTKKDGLGFIYTKEDRGHFKVPKVILSLGRHQYPYNDYDGEYGMSNTTFGIPISSREEGEEIIEFIDTDEFKEILKYSKWSTFMTDHRMFKYFRKQFWKKLI